MEILFEPNLEELQELIKEAELRIQEADSPAEMEYYQNQLEEYLEKQSELLKNQEK